MGLLTSLLGQLVSMAQLWYLWWSLSSIAFLPVLLWYRLSLFSSNVSLLVRLWFPTQRFLPNAVLRCHKTRLKLKRWMRCIQPNALLAWNQIKIVFPRTLSERVQNLLFIPLLNLDADRGSRLSHLRVRHFDGLLKISFCVQSTTVPFELQDEISAGCPVHIAGDGVWGTTGIAAKHEGCVCSSGTVGTFWWCRSC